MMLLRASLLLIVAVLCNGAAPKTQIPIGAIFHEDNKDAEIAFRYALIRENRASNSPLEFVPEIRYVERADSIKAERLACNLAADGVIAIFGPSSRQTAGIVASVCNRLGIPHLIGHWEPDDLHTKAVAVIDDDADADADDDSEDEVEEDSPKPYSMHTFTRNFFPDRDVYAQMLATLIADSKWNGFTLIYDTADSLERLQDVLQIHDPTKNPVTVHQLPPGDGDDVDYKPLLKLIEKSGDSNILIDCAPAKVLRLLNQAVDVNLTREYERYIITSLDAHVLDYGALRYSLANFTAFRMMNPDGEEVMNRVLEWRSNELRLPADAYDGLYANGVRTETALFNDAVQHFMYAVRWVNSMRRQGVRPNPVKCDAPSRGKQGRRLLKASDGHISDGMTGRVVFDAAGRRSNFYMQVLELNKNVIATWDAEEGIRYMRSTDALKTQITQSLQNKTVMVSARIGKPWLFLKSMNDGITRTGNDRFEGFSLDLIESIAKEMSFQYKIVPVPGNAYGSYNKMTRKWDGLIKELLDRRADLAICDLTITQERRSVVDFTMPFMTLGISILFAKPKTEQPTLFSFLKPLSLEVWIYMMTTYLGVSVVLFLAAKFSADDWENPHPCNDDPEELENLWNMHNCVWLTVGAIMQQGCDLLPKAVSTRLIVSFWWFFALIVTTSYTANLAAFLTKEQMEASVKNADELSKQTSIQYGAVTGGSTLSFFQKSNYSTYQKMYAVMESNPSVFVRHNDEGVDRVARGNHKYAFLCESSTIEYEVNRNCNLTQVGGLLDSKHYGIAMPVNSPYRTYISQTVLRLQEDGTLHEIKEKWWKLPENETNMEGCQVESSGETGMSLSNVGGVFLVLLCGCAVGLMFGVMEFMWNLRQVAIDNKITPCEAFYKELKFALDVRKTTKPVFIDSNRSSASAASATASQRSNSETGDEQSSGNLSMRSFGVNEQRQQYINRNKKSGLLLSEKQQLQQHGGASSFRHLNSI